ncbi:hypothetical protein SeMB42_g03991 [Synchytrium endobioticum]|uniref:Uncharacterized protein n=1 Tax=Synchytrium endobioticum TaxID=286115 RepID=A0A507D2K6_9FUNG|nr:hypothetical protein SeMB42_g03991 [Synchytrium endobioticum]
MAIKRTYHIDEELEHDHRNHPQWCSQESQQNTTTTLKMMAIMRCLAHHGMAMMIPRTEAVTRMKGLRGIYPLCTLTPKIVMNRIIT